MSTPNRRSPAPTDPDAAPTPAGVTHVLLPRDTAGAEVVREFAWRGEEIEVTGDVSRGDAGLVISRLEVQAPMPMGLTHKLLHRIPLGEILAQARADISHRASLPRLFVIGEGIELPIPPGRVLVTDDLLRQLALSYLEETRPGKDRAVLQRLEELFGRPKGTIRTWLARARAEGWLGPAVQGRMGAEPGPRLLQELARIPRAEKTGPGQITIYVPPDDETADEAQRRALTEWRERSAPGYEVPTVRGVSEQ